MKTLVNKSNPSIRITAPEIEEYEHFYSIPNWYGYNKSDWTLVEEEPEKLTWEEAQRLYLITRQVCSELDSCSKNFPKWGSSTKNVFEEILRRFYE